MMSEHMQWLPQNREVKVCLPRVCLQLLGIPHTQVGWLLLADIMCCPGFGEDGIDGR
jgi:hypothetical protein